MPARQLMTAAEIAADPDKWKRLRRLGIGASEVAAMFGICNEEYGSPFELFVEKTTGVGMRGDKDAMARGRYLEPYVVERFAHARPELGIVDGGLYASAQRSWQMATFDRLAVDLAAAGITDSVRPPVVGVTDRKMTYPVQIKTSVPRWRQVREYPEDWGPPGTDQIPDAYRAQVLAEMDVWEADLVLVPVLFVQSWKLEVYYISRSDDAEADMKLIREEGERFMNRIADNDPPEIDWTPATRRALRTLYPACEEFTQGRVTRRLAEQYRNARRAQKLATQRLDLAINQMIAASAGAREIVALVNGEDRQVALRRAYSKTIVDVEKLRRKYPHIAREVEKSSDVDAMFPGRWAKE